ncbi:hypothetical protein MKZ38_003795 [Zalerion maritima]|uniref:Protein HIR n=1 Tax=Zalerion maritima TaxID=339359 RepID=A0AAD5RN99_9PEZI|nr:hypothetical protein MKZ38_003795 [Zalerion maritima]
MLIIKPSWLSHSGEQKDFEVYSCHISPDGSRLATAGGDGHVRIWSTEAIYRSEDPSYTKPRQLCHMSHHLGTIHTIRFSPNGRYLASGADDKIICIYYFDDSPAPAVAFGSNEPPPVENWKTHKRLVGHENDVQDLAWSADSSLLVSVGLDSKIVVWSGHTFEKLKTIAAHQSHVKGITFDPANKFFATAADDRTIKIFRFTSPAPNATQHDMVNNFVHEATISQPFKSSPLTTYFRRCSWSPDGNHIAAANATNGPVSSVAIIERNTWDSEINLIGHEQPTEVCMFSPRLFYTKKPAENGTANGDSGGALVTVIASSGQDRTLSIWNTNTSRPLVILQDLAAKSVSDLSWTPDGQTLFACSLDGNILAVKFETGELGWVARPEENDKALQKYGGSRKGMGMAEDVDGLQLEDHSKAGEIRGAESRMGALMGDLPKTLVVNGVKSKDSEPQESAPKPPEGEDADNDSKEGEKSTTETPDKTAQRITELKSRVTVGKDGKKRVAPLLVSGSGTGQSSLPQSQLVGATSTKTAQAEKPQTILDISKPYDGLPEKGLAALLLGNKRKATDMSDNEDEDTAGKRSSQGPVPIMVNGLNGVEPMVSQAPPSGQPPIPEYLRPAITNTNSSIAQVRLGVPKVRSRVLRPLEAGQLKEDMSLEEASKTPENIVFEVRNPVNIRDPSHVTVSKRGTLLWEDYLPRAALLITGNKNFWAAACEDGSIYAWSPAGRRLISPMIISAQPVILECREHFILCISAVGLVHVWNLKSLSAPSPPISLAPVLEAAATTLHSTGPTPSPGITFAGLNSDGQIIITLSNGTGYFYDNRMWAWQRASEGLWAVGSQYWNSNDSSISALQTTAVGPVNKDKNSRDALVSAGIIPFLERHTTTEFLLKGRAFTLQRLVKTLLPREGFENFEACVSIAHLENRIAASLQLGSAQEFGLYVCMYAKRLGAEGHRGKVEELLSGLLGDLLKDKKPVENTTVPRGWFAEGERLCGWDRIELLKAVVMILGKYRELQRLTVQYARILDLTMDEEDEDTGPEGNTEAMMVEP